MARARTFTRGAKRQAFWSPVMVETRVVALGAAASLGATSVGETAQERLTLVRVRGEAFVTLDAGSVFDSMQVALGLIVVKTEAFVVGGAASMPGPITDIEQSWLWHHIFVMGPAVVAADDGADISRNVRVEIDGKAQRKMQAEETLAFVWEATILAGSPTIDGQAAVRSMFLAV